MCDRDAVGPVHVICEGHFLRVYVLTSLFHHVCFVALLDAIYGRLEHAVVVRKPCKYNVRYSIIFQVLVDFSVMEAPAIAKTRIVFSVFEVAFFDDCVWHL